MSSFLSFAVCKNRGGRRVPFYHVDDVSVYLGRQSGEGSPIDRTDLRPPRVEEPGNKLLTIQLRTCLI